MQLGNFHTGVIAPATDCRHKSVGEITPQAGPWKQHIGGPWVVLASFFHTNMDSRRDARVRFDRVT
jgi:hypothetical protein